MITSRAIVHVVDDDPQTRELLAALVRSVGLTAKMYVSAERFLENYAATPDLPSCLILDAFLPGMNGFELQRKLADGEEQIPIIMISAYADVSMALEAVHAGALDFLEKPFSRQALIERIGKAIDHNARQLRAKAERADVAACLATLSPREREVMELLLIGKRTKQISKELGVCDQTVARHRLRVLEKMGVDTVAELVHLVFTSSSSRASVVL